MNSDDRFISETPMTGDLAPLGPSEGDERLHPITTASRSAIGNYGRRAFGVRRCIAAFLGGGVECGLSPPSSIESGDESPQSKVVNRQAIFSWASRLGRTESLFMPPVEPDGAHDDNAFDDLLVVRRNIEQVESVIDDAHQQRARQGSTDAADAAGEGSYRRSPRRRWHPTRRRCPRWAGRW